MTSSITGEGEESLSRLEMGSIQGSLPEGGDLKEEKLARCNWEEAVTSLPAVGTSRVKSQR